MANQTSRQGSRQGTTRDTRIAAGDAKPVGKRKAARRRSRSRALLIAALLGLALALGLVIYIVFASTTGTASIAAQHFCDALVARDYASAYAQLAPSLRQQGSAQQFAASQQDLDRINGAASSCRFSAQQVRGNRATFTLILTRAQSGTMSGALDLVQVQGGWQVDAYDANVL